MPARYQAPSRCMLLITLKRHGSIKAAAEHYGVSAGTVREWMNDRGIKREGLYKARAGQPPRMHGTVNKPARLRPSKPDLLAAIDSLGFVTRLLAIRFGAHPDTVRKWYAYYHMAAPAKHKLEPDDLPLIMALKGFVSSNECGIKFEVAARTIRDVWSGKRVV